MYKFMAVIILSLVLLTGCKQSMVCTDVIDGDTITVNNKTVRVLEIDTPEVNEPGYAEATECMKQLVLHKEVELNVWKLDKYGRTLAYVYVDGQSVSDLMIRADMSEYVKPY